MRARARMVATALSGALLLAGCDFDGAYDLPLPGHEVSADESIEVTADFADVLNVVPRSTVMVDDVVVGEVTEVERVGWHARVTLRLRKDVELPDNAIADIRQVSLLGEKYVALEAPAKPSADRLEDRDRIPLAATGRNPEVEEVLGALSFLLSGGGVAQLGTITREANLVMSGREDRLRNLLSSLEGVVGTVDQQKVQIVQALESMNRLTTTLNKERRTIGAALDATGPAIKVLAAQHDELVEMLTALDELGKVGTRVIGATKEDVLAILKDIEPVLRKLREADDKLAPGVNLLASFPFPAAASDIVKGDYANTIARVEIDLANLYKTLGIPDIQLPDLGQVVGGVAKCLQSGNLFGPECLKVISDVTLLKDLKTQCQAANMRDTLVCQLLARIPNIEDLLGGLTKGLTDGSASSGLLPGLLGSPTSAEPSSPHALLGAST